MFLSLVVFADVQKNALRREALADYFANLFTYKIGALTSTDLCRLENRYENSNVLLKVLTSLTTTQQIKIKNILDQSENCLTIGARLELEIMAIRNMEQKSLSRKLLKYLHQKINNRTIDIQSITLITIHRDLLNKLPRNRLYERALKIFPTKVNNIIQSESFSPISKAKLRDLFYFDPDLSTYREGEYNNSIKIFMFCRKNRDYPCIMVAKDQFNLPVYTENNENLWHHRSLAASYRGLPFNIRNGQTPQGVHSIDSVMPYANRQDAFGKFRRIILNWIPRSENEKLSKIILPNSVHNDHWWLQANTARDLGRNDLRVHGTGRINDDPNSFHYPFRKTSGCVSQREGTYENITYFDQRKLLDTLMSNLGMAPEFDNEELIKGLFYLVEIDKQMSPVTLAEIESILLER